MLPSVGVVILGGGRGTRLSPLTANRAKPAVPIGGKYRLVDIPISNAIHSDMRRMLLLTQFNSHSLHKHILNTYRFDDFSDGYLQLLAAQQTPASDGWFQGTADAVRQNITYIQEMGTEYVLVLAGDHMYRMDYRNMLRDHIEAHADITIAVQTVSEADIAGFGALRVDESGRIVEFREKPKTPEALSGLALEAEWMATRGLPVGRPYLASMGIYLFRTQVLLSALAGDEVDFGRDIIPTEVKNRCVQASFYTGYWRDIGTTRAFYDAHMDLVSPNPPFRFDARDWPIFTRSRYLPPARISESSFNRTCLSDGTIIMNSVIEDSVIGIRATIRGATVRRTLHMGADAHEVPAGPDAPPVGVGEGTVIDKAIIDKNVRIGRNVRITNDAHVVEGEGKGWAIRDGIVVIPKNAVVHDGTII
ncbi:MAG: sugar phosphate nucleotidyltransferase [Myxococcota bacterium]|nr:sugar phosphate nucleotidyltransferase [Myxococcota bacterium]